MTTHFKPSKLWLMLSTWAGDVREGFIEITRHSLALIGLAVVVVAVTFAARPALQLYASETLIGWLEMRQAEPVDVASLLHGATRSTAVPLTELTPAQLAVTQWLGRKYKISPEPMGALVIEAWLMSARSQISPTLILAVMGTESRFNPFASGSQGALGLMQIDPKTHDAALTSFGGYLAIFDPVTNLRIGARHLQQLIQQSPSVEDALKLYATMSGQLGTDQYVERILSEQKQLDKITQSLQAAPGAVPSRLSAPSNLKNLWGS